ncbi:hypothetical protein CNYM01_01138 [Colletotrichum nymphaeae SA-01]|uniref:Uncharacterized protein n=1 Tax=Colletotrichum nymphaeae SA-01 TaxID=1460502 RepID=A0A135TZ25_9PEZI|nr:hypothetical protein CNYM01_01138 [Colletotrichum nymphaeae SA-01]
MEETGKYPEQAPDQTNSSGDIKQDARRKAKKEKSKEDVKHDANIIMMADTGTKGKEKRNYDSKDKEPVENFIEDPVMRATFHTIESTTKAVKDRRKKADESSAN